DICVSVAGGTPTPTPTPTATPTPTPTPAPPPVTCGVVNNTGFETGDFSGWTPTGIASVGTGFPRSGAFAADLGTGTLSQIVPTVPGQSYNVSFWLRLDSGAGLNTFAAAFAGVPVITTPIVNSGGFAYTQFTLNNVQAAPLVNFSVLEFTFANTSQVFHLDDVCVSVAAGTPTPTPTATPMPTVTPTPTPTATPTPGLTPQTITVNPAAPATATVGTTFPVGATSSSGLPVTITASGSCAVQSGGTGTAVILVTSSGTCTVLYSQAGNASFAPAQQASTTSTTTAGSIAQTITVNPAAPATATVGTTFPVGATSNSGLPVTITASGSCAVQTGGTGTAVILVTSSGTCSVLYSQMGNVNFAPAQVASTTTTTAGLTPQSITVNPAAPATATVGTTFPVGATSSSGLPVTITASGSCAVQSGGTGTAVILVTSSGNCTISYSQMGNASFAPAQVTSVTTVAVVGGGGLEADVATRFTGDGVLRANDVEQERLFVSRLEVPNPLTNEFQRADVAPYETRGDGSLNAADFQLVKNYVANLVAQQAAGGPNQAVATALPLEERDADAVGRTMRIVSADAQANRKASVSVEMDSLGDEVVALFTINFDASRLSNPVVTLGEGVPEGTTLTANTRKAFDGQVTVLIDSPAPFTTSYAARVVTITFDIAKDAPVGETPISFDSGSFSDAEARSLRATYKDGSITIKGRTHVARIFEEDSFSLFGLMTR
ncbi:MAG TPA: hypothetical protein VNA17_00110, partial [Pyrinomonadaceae bacterium]|nr:hypothetical protein [Pyrinomonadaceae bacterium]